MASGCPRTNDRSSFRSTRPRRSSSRRAPAAAAARELREETGYAAEEIVDLGWVHPNPAIQSNRCHTFLARNVSQVGEPDPDPNESFEQLTVPLVEIPRWIAEGRLTHSLVVAAFQLLAGRRE